MDACGRNGRRKSPAAKPLSTLNNASLNRGRGSNTDLWNRIEGDADEGRNGLKSHTRSWSPCCLAGQGPRDSIPVQCATTLIAYDSLDPLQGREGAVEALKLLARVA